MSPISITKTDSSPTYAKIIGADLHGWYPYRVGLNTLKHNKETFDPAPRCVPGGLYFCDIKNICDWWSYGDTLCIVKPVGEIVAVGNKFKTDKLEIVSMIPLVSIEAFRCFCEHGVADVKTLLLHRAIENYCVDMVRYIVESGVGNSYTLIWTARNGHLDILKRLVENGMDIRIRDDHLLRWAAREGHLDVVEFLVDRGANVHARKNLALRWAAEFGHLDIVVLLVDHGADVHAKGDLALQAAAQGGHLDIAEFLVDRGANINAVLDNSMLRWSTKKRHRVVVEFLIKRQQLFRTELRLLRTDQKN